MALSATQPGGTASTGSEVPRWRIQGKVILACNCDFGCPCNFNGLPTYGKCEGNWNWHIDEGSYGDVSLAGLNFGVAVNWPAAIHDGNGEGIAVIDERADASQRRAIESLVSGRAGGPWKIISTTISKLHGPEFAPFTISAEGLSSVVRAGAFISLDLEPVRNKVTGVATHARAVLPEGFVFKEADLGASSHFRISGPVSFDHSGRYAAAAPFVYEGP